MSYNLVEAVKAAHGLGKVGREQLQQAILETYGPQEVVTKELSPAEKEAAASKAELAREQAKAAEEAQLKRETQQVGDIMAALGHGDVGESREGALRAITEVIGAAEVVQEASPALGKSEVRANPGGENK